MIGTQYIDIKFKSSGKFGSVCSASDVKNGLTVAIKKIELEYHRKDEYKRIYREMDILEHLNSRYSLWLMNVYKVVSDDKLLKVFFVMPLMNYDLHHTMNKYLLTYTQIMQIIYQILLALQYLYDAGIIHRDLKPSNIGINNNMDIRLLDFGLAREVNGDMTEYVVTRWYRPIEVFCNNDYTTAVDMWSVGCIFAEFFIKRVLFKGTSKNDQVTKIIQITGFPDEEMLASIDNENIVAGLKIYQSLASKTNCLDKHIRKDVVEFVRDQDGCDPRYSGEVIQLISRMLDLNPMKRIRPLEALGASLFEPHRAILDCYLLDGTAETYSCSVNINHESDESLQQKLIERIDRFTPRTNQC